MGRILILSLGCVCCLAFFFNSQCVDGLPMEEDVLQPAPIDGLTNDSEGRSPVWDRSRESGVRRPWKGRGQQSPPEGSDRWSIPKSRVGNTVETRAENSQFNSHSVGEEISSFQDAASNKNSAEIVPISCPYPDALWKLTWPGTGKTLAIAKDCKVRRSLAGIFRVDSSGGCGLLVTNPTRNRRFVDGTYTCEGKDGNVKPVVASLSVYNKPEPMGLLRAASLTTTIQTISNTIGCCWVVCYPGAPTKRCIGSCKQ